MEINIENFPVSKSVAYEIDVIQCIKRVESVLITEKYWALIDNQLNAIRHSFQAQSPNQTLPVIIVATHCDRLRPVREWGPSLQ
ncbi:MULTISPECIES: hypothetical protein [Methylobacter]